MQHARLQKLQRFRLNMPFDSFLILWYRYLLAELVMHQERVDRHSKGISVTLNEFKTRFQTMIEEHNNEVRQKLFQNIGYVCKHGVVITRVAPMYTVC